MHNFVRGKRIETIHNFVDGDRLATVPADARQRVRQSLGFAAETPLLGAIGKVIPRKGLIHLVRGLPRILAAVPQARLLVVGGKEQSPYARQVRAAAAQAGTADRITWTSHRDDIPEILAALDLLVLPSLEESFPLSILEAMASGLPVVATTVGGIPECVVPGQTGLLVPPARSDLLAAAVVELLGDRSRARRFGAAGRNRVQERFSAASQTPCIEALFTRVAHRRAA
jgi:glycosyltransferase involved in cell wall biosynthesis